MVLVKCVRRTARGGYSFIDGRLNAVINYTLGSPPWVWLCAVLMLVKICLWPCKILLSAGPDDEDGDCCANWCGGRKVIPVVAPSTPSDAAGAAPPEPEPIPIDFWEDVVPAP